MKYPKLRELKEAIKAIIYGHYTTKFPKEPFEPQPGFRGRPVPDRELCIGCGACAQVCPPAAIEVKDDTSSEKPARTMIWHYDLCIYCGQCENLCTTKKGVVLSREFDLATDDRTTLHDGITKELTLCEKCGTIIGTREQLLWIFNKIGPFSSGNYNLLSANQRELGISDDVASQITDHEMQRADLYRVLCPKCRHTALVFNQTGKMP